MKQLKDEGVTIVLVSHAHTRVIQLCEQALWMHQGQSKKTGPSKEVVKSYLAFLDDQEAKKLKKADTSPVKKRKNSPKRKPSTKLYGAIYDSFDQIDNLEVKFLVDNRETNTVKIHDEVVIEYSFELKVNVKDLNVSLVFYRNDGLMVTGLSTLNGDLISKVHSGQVRCRLTIPDFNLNPASYVLVMPIHEGHSYLYRNVVKEFVVTLEKDIVWGVVDLNYKYEYFNGRRELIKIYNKADKGNQKILMTTVQGVK